MTSFKCRYRIETTRLRGWDYGGAGWYFVTICARNRQTFFGAVENGAVRLSPIGEIARDYWAQIPHHTTANVAIDAFVVMPNHIHGIVAILDPPNANVETLQCNVSTTAPAARDPDNPMAHISPRAGSLGAIIRSYKSAAHIGVTTTDMPGLDGRRVVMTVSSAINAPCTSFAVILPETRRNGNMTDIMSNPGKCDASPEYLCAFAPLRQSF